MVKNKTLFFLNWMFLKGDFLMNWGEMGSGQVKFHSPVGLALAPDGSIYVAEGNRVQKSRQR